MNIVYLIFIDAYHMRWLNKKLYMNCEKIIIKDYKKSKYIQ